MKQILPFFVIFLVSLSVEPSSTEISVTPECVFSGVKGTVSAPKQIIISNAGTEPLLVSSLSITGANSNAFALVNPPVLPKTIEAGQTFPVSVRFNPPLTAVGSLSAQLNIASNDTTVSNGIVGLYGLSANGEQGNSEPPLDGVVKTLGYNINVGGTTLILSTGAAAIGDEVLTPLFQKAGTGVVTMKAVARYSPDDTLSFGYYTKNNGAPVVTEIGKIRLNQEQTLLPALTAGSTTSFDPDSAVFGFYTGATSYAEQNTYTEDHLNTGPLRHSVRVYPLKDRAGVLMPNRYLVAFEPANNGDYQDYVFEVSNVKPITNSSRILEAEDAFLSRAVFSSNRPGYTGTGFADIVNNSDDYIEWTIYKISPGQVSLKFRYSNASTLNRPLKLEVNGIVVPPNLAFPGTGSWSNWSTSAVVTVNLISGSNKIRLTAIGFNGGNIDHLEWAEFSPPPPLPVNSGILEAELATLHLAKVQSNQAGYTGSGFVDYINNNGDYVQWKINTSTATSAMLKFRYANGSVSNRPLKLEVNGLIVNSGLNFLPSGAWTKWLYSAIPVNLTSGENNIRLTTIGFNGGNIDHLDWAVIAQIPPPIEQGILESEVAVLHQAIVKADRVGYTGSGFADYINNSNDFIEWTINKTNTGMASLNFRYANGSVTNRPLRVEVNGAVIAENLAFVPTGSWTNWSYASINSNLTSGVNKVKLTAIGFSGGNIDHLDWKEIVSGTSTNVSIVEEQDVLKDQKISISPNPASSIVRVHFNRLSVTPVQITLLDITGKVHRTISLRSRDADYFEFPVSNLPSGIYFIVIRNGNRKYSSRLLINNK